MGSPQRANKESMVQGRFFDSLKLQKNHYELMMVVCLPVLLFRERPPPLLLHIFSLLLPVQLL